MILQKDGIGENRQEGGLLEPMERESGHFWRQRQNEAAATVVVVIAALCLAITVDIGQPSPSAKTGSAALSLLDLNLASQPELQAVPQIGPSLAARIVAFRQLQGPFHSVDDLRQVPGLGAGRVARLKPFFIIAGENKASDRKDVQANRWAVSTASAISASGRSTQGDRAVGSRSP